MGRFRWPPGFMVFDLDLLMQFSTRILGPDIFCGNVGTVITRYVTVSRDPDTGV